MAATKPWAIRIPAAIADGERLLDGGECGDVVYLAATSELTFTAGELAMAKAAHQWHPDPICADSGCLTGPALVAFTEKMEALSHD